MVKELREFAVDFKNAHVDLAVYAAKNQEALDKKVWDDLVVEAANADLAMQHAFADAQAEIARLRGALEPHRSGPDFYDWIADRLVHVYGESEGVDFVLTLRRRAQLGREALKDVK